MDKDGSKKVVGLGKFIKSGHLKWLEGNPHKRPVKGQQLSYLYTMGSICEETGKHRQTEVRQTLMSIFKFLLFSKQKQNFGDPVNTFSPATTFLPFT